MFNRLLHFLAFFAGTIGMAQAETKLQYNINITQPQTHYAQVTLTIENYSGTALHFKMPVWTPGSYLVREFEKSIESLKVLADGKPIDVFHPNKNTWTIENLKAKKIELSYSIYAFEFSVRTSFIDASHAFLHNTSIFMYADELQNSPGRVVLHYPAQWKNISTSLNKLDEPATFSFENYDELADSPIEIGNHEQVSFEVMGVTHTLAMVGPGNYNLQKFTTDLQKMCSTMGEIVGEHPCKNYVFFVQNVENGGGGLEHKNSCCVMMSRWNYSDPSKYRDFLGLCAHEYFHLWNVKRIRPIELGPFNYSEENYTRQLWVAEGITSYYDELALLRAGLVSQREFVQTLETYINNLENRPGSKVQTLAESSFDAWIKEYRPNENSKNTSISYYSKGLVVAALLDAEICATTGGAMHLDDLMKLLYKRFYKEKKRGFDEKEFIAAASEIAKKDMGPFFSKYLYSLETPDYATILGGCGLQVKKQEENKKELGISTALENGRTVIKSVTRNSAAWIGGLNVNDELIAINGVRVNNDADAVVRNLSSPGIITAVVNRSGLVSEITFDLLPLQTINYDLQMPEKTSAVLEKWLGKNP